jgi:surface antigen
MTKVLRALLVLAALASLSFPAPADPPPWAPAHGWRKKNDPNYVGYTGKKWDNDYGVLDGTCDSAKVGAVLGGAVGGAIGSQVAKDSPNRPVAVVVGAVLGTVIGSKIGAEIDAGDRGCMGHALELAGEQKSVKWTNAQTGVAFVLTPTRNFGDLKNPCREFTALAAGAAPGQESHGKGKGKGKGAARKARFHGTACRQGSGEWVVKS